MSDINRDMDLKRDQEEMLRLEKIVMEMNNAFNKLISRLNSQGSDQ